MMANEPWTSSSSSFIIIARAIESRLGSRAPSIRLCCTVCYPYSNNESRACDLRECVYAIFFFRPMVASHRTLYVHLAFRGQGRFVQAMARHFYQLSTGDSFMDLHDLLMVLLVTCTQAISISFLFTSVHQININLLASFLVSDF